MSTIVIAVAFAIAAFIGFTLGVYCLLGLGVLLVWLEYTT